IEKDVSSRQAFRRCLDVTVRGPNNSATFLKSVNGKIDWPRADRATARQRYSGASCSRKQRPENENRSAHRFHTAVRRIVAENFLCVQPGRVVLFEFHSRA